ncbi:MAG: peptide deformylase [candidate division Zixibacteria bacterium]|nr:peptide deformylase [candidate division Zixibacteria bacterium]
MAIRPIVKYGSAVLREISRPVGDITPEIKDLVADMVATLKAASGLGLAAVQVGVSLRIFIVDLSALEITAEPKVFINPEIVETSGATEYEEGCLSFPGIYQLLTRPDHVRVRALGLDGKEFVVETDGIYARTILHEYDHLDGVMFIDHFSTVSRALVDRKLKKLAKSA